MQYRLLGRTGLRVSALCLGTMQFGWTADEEQSFKVLDAAHEAGINFLDTADIYSRWAEGNPGGVSEAIIGRWWRQAGVQRHRLILASKVRGSMGEDPNEAGLSRGHILWSIERSLERLQTDYLDLYQLHWPDEDTPIEETLRTLDDLIRQGVVRAIGCSNFKAWQLVESLWSADVHHLESFATLQPHYNLLHREEYEQDLEAVCQRYGLAVIPYSPLAGGVLTGKYSRDGNDPDSQRASSQSIQNYLQQPSTWATLEALKRVGQQHGKSISQIALAWLLHRDSITSPIIGPRTLAQLEDNLGCVDVVLSLAQYEEIDSASSRAQA
ncbi:MAG: aldo/keto reductase [Anaerolineales bacterium]|jgi:aryl-alcohol dehydrogenase-like predicted oxidoreductase